MNRLVQFFEFAVGARVNFFARAAEMSWSPFLSFRFICANFADSLLNNNCFAGCRHSRQLSGWQIARRNYPRRAAWRLLREADDYL